MATPEDRLGEIFRTIDSTQGSIEPVEGVDDPLGDIFRQVDTRQAPTVAGPEIQKGLDTFFARGVKTGATAPLTIFTGEGEQKGPVADDVGEVVAEGLGNFAGAILGYLPVSKGAGMILKGAGLIKSAKLFQTGYAGVAKETLAGGLFDAGMSTEVSQIPERFVRGAVIGGGAEIGIMGAISAFRIGVPNSRIASHLAKEETLSLQPGDEVEKILQTRTMTDMGEADIEVVVATLEGAGPLDAAILGQVEDPKLVENVVKRTWGDAVEAITRQNDDGAFEVILWNKEMSRFRNVDGTAMGMPELKNPPKDYEEAFKIINDGMVEKLDGTRLRNLELSVETFESLKAFAKFRRRSTSDSATVSGAAYPATKSLGSRIGINASFFDEFGPKERNAQMISTLIHEYTHALTGVTRGQNLFNVMKYSTDEIAQLKLDGLKAHGSSRFYPTLKGEAKEWVDLALLTLEKRGREFADLKEINSTGHEFAEYYDYFASHAELLPRAVEALFLDRETAFKIAPRVAKRVEDLLVSESGKLSQIINPATPVGQALKQINKIFNARWVIRNGNVEFFSAQPAKLTGAQRAQWKRGEKAIQGMRVKTKDGKLYEWQGRGRNGKARLKDGSTGKIIEVPETDVVVPTFGQVIGRNAEVKKALLTKFDEGVDSLAFNGRGVTGAFQRGLIRGMTEMKKVKSLRQYVLDNKELFRDDKGFLRLDDIRFENSAAQRVMDTLGDDALVVVAPDGAVSVKFRNADVAENYIQMGDEFSAAFNMGVDDVVRTTDGKVVEVKFTSENVMDGILRDAGVPEGLIPFYKEQFKEGIWDRIVEQLDPEDVALVRKAENIEVDADSVMEVTDTMNASRAVGLESFETSTGQIAITSADGVILDVVDDADAAQSFINNYRGPDLKPLDLDAPVSTTVTEAPTPWAGRPAMPLETPEMKKGLFDRFSVLIPSLGSMERFMSAAETMGIGPLWSSIFQPTQQAVKKIGFEMQNTKIAAFGGKTYQEMLEQISAKALQIAPSRRGIPSRLIESLSRTEIEAGAGHSRGMNLEELEVAKMLESLGFKHQGARLLAIDRMVQIYRNNAKQFYTQVIPTLQKKMHKLSPAQQEIVEKFGDPAVMAKLTDSNNPLPENMVDLLKTVGYTDAEIKAVSLVGANKGRGADEFSFALVNRWLDAEFMSGNGRQQFKKKYKVTTLEESLADDMEAVFYEAAQEAGLDAERYLLGYFPHLRTTGRFGLDAAAHSEYLKGFSDITNEFIEYVRTGELEMYSRDPARVTSKYVRAMKMKNELQPVLDGIYPVIEQLQRTDPRSARIVKEYIAELRNQPTESFQRLEGAIQQTFDLLGVNVPEDLGKRMVTALTSLSYKAAIPFRLALVVRNWAQTVLMTPPRVGSKWYVEGVKAALEDGAYQKALKAGAIDANTLPLAYGDDMLSQTVGQSVFDDIEKLNEFRDKFHRLGLHKANEKIQNIFRAGFDWYRKPDDVGRAIAYYAQKLRTSDAIARYRRGEIDFATMLQEGKVNTFNEPVIELFSSLLKQKKDEAAADLLGVQLSRETHFRYGHANHPVGWGGVAGRLFGQFGTFPIQYAEYLVQGMRRGSAKDRAEFLATHVAVNSAIVAGGSAIGLNLGNWSTFPSIGYTGGPYADLALTLTQAMSGSPAEKAMARRNLNMMLPTLENPKSIFVPGAYFAGDIAKAFQRDFDMQSLGEAAGFRFLTGEDDESDWFTRMLTGG